MSDHDCPHYNAQNLVSSIQGRFIYKDECAKCYVNQKSDEGVNLCLTCLVGGCDNHSRLHLKQSKHPLVLNFKAKLKPKVQQEEEPKPKEITRLAIGKPGGADFTDEEWELLTEVRCLECNKTLDPAKFQGIIDSVIKAESASMKSALSAWELEIKPCAHTMTMEQTSNQKLADKSLAHCGQCELSTNLWLCLFCGHLGCGRKNYDGTGGNNHAREHHTQTGHTVVVKLGTITPDGNASVHCYGCDEEVEDEKLAEHLHNFGINIAKLQKTEKTVAELNLQLNLNLTLSSVIEKGRKITPVFGEGFTGMQNLGNSCYMNSVLQVLFVLDEFKQRYNQEGLKHLETCTSYAPECFLCQMSKVGVGLYSGEHSKEKKAEPLKVEGQEDIELEAYQDGIRPAMFKMLVGKGHPEFSTDRQQDATEYLRHLFTFMQKAEKKASLADLTKIFDFKSTTQLICQTCNGYKLTENIANDIQLPIPQSNNFKEEEDPTNPDKAPEKIPLVNFKDCLDAFQTEFVSLNCPKCNTSNNNFKKTYYFKTWPKYLITTLSRTVLDQWVPRKDVSEILFDSEVQDFSRFKLPELDPSQRIEEEAGGQDEGPQIDQTALDQLSMMGFSVNRAKRGLIEKNNNVEEAMNWLFEKMEDPTLDDPIPVAKKSGKAAVNPELIQLIVTMGFTETQAKFALGETNNDPDRAVDYLFNHPEVDELIGAAGKGDQGGQKEAEVEDTGVYKYQIKGVIVHLGKNYHSGHYVCYIKKDGKWIYFNDAKVAESTDPAIGKGVLYMFERCSA